MGDHRKHNRDFGIIPDVIGGQYCGCTGDCAEESKKEFEMMFPDFTLLWAEEPIRYGYMSEYDAWREGISYD